MKQRGLLVLITHFPFLRFSMFGYVKSYGRYRNTLKLRDEIQNWRIEM